VEWWVVVPAKRLAHAKTRLLPVTVGLGAGARGRHRDLVLALLADTVAAAAACPPVSAVLVVTDEPEAAAVVTALGARTVADEPDAGLNPALAHGARQARAGGAAAVAALNSDLPALQPAELAAALAAAAGHRRSFVADAEGSGTTLLCATAGELDPRYGPGSAAAHAASGAVPLDGHWPGLRRDVDTPDDLTGATALGLGPRTARLLPAAGPAER